MGKCNEVFNVQELIEWGQTETNLVLDALERDWWGGYFANSLVW